MSNLKILVIDDEQLIGWTFQKKLSKKGYEILIALSAEDGLDIFKKESPEIVFLDNKLPNMNGIDLLPNLKQIDDDAIIIFMSAYGSIESAVKAIKLGADDYVNKPFTFEEIDAILNTITERITLKNKLKVLQRKSPEELHFNNIIGKSKELMHIIELSKKISQSQASTVLLLGESGTGKDLLARVIHNESKRNDRPFITINCSSLPDTLLESELFGHERGAFTDAHKQKKGLFEIADGGTVYLDEIGEVSMAVQIKLLNIIENKYFRRVGGTKDLNVDIRIIAATNQNLDELIKNKQFRYDLYYRLKVFQVTLPALRDRKEDIPLLINHFTQQFNNQFRKRIKGISEEAKELFMQYNWPGNVRELRNVLERAIILEQNDYLQITFIPDEIKDIKKPAHVESVHEWLEIPDDGFSLYELEKNIIKQTLHKANYNQTKAAKLMGISRDTLRYKIKKYLL